MKAGNGEVTCWGTCKQAQHKLCIAPHTTSTSVVQLTAGQEHSCALKTNGHVTCWGSTEYGQCHTPSDLSSVAQIQAGAFHTCAVNNTGGVICWGLNDHRQSAVPQDLEKVKELAAGGGHTCALLAEGNSEGSGEGSGGVVDCWGSPKSKPPPGLGNVTQITAGDDYTCALKRDGSVTCWGEDSKWTQVPSGLEPTSEIVARGCNTCAIGNSTGKLHCWGCDSFSQTKIPPQFESGVVEVAVGYSDPSAHGHICALKKNGLAACWGANDNGQSNVPPKLRVAPPCQGKLALRSLGFSLRVYRNPRR